MRAIVATQRQVACRMVFDRLEAIAAESARIAEVVDDVDLQTLVPSCPGWRFGDLVFHLGEVQRFWAENVRSANPAGPWNGDRIRPRSEPDLRRWFSEGTAYLVAALVVVQNPSTQYSADRNLALSRGLGRVPQGTRL